MATLLAVTAYADHLKSILPCMPYIDELDYGSANGIYDNSIGETIGEFREAEGYFIYRD